MKNTKGFTLMELLTIIVIISIISLITVTVVSHIIEISKEKSTLTSAHKIKDALEQYYISYDISGKMFEGYVCKFPNNCSEIKLSGTKPTQGYLEINKEGTINGMISFNNEYFYNFENDAITKITNPNLYEYYAQQLLDVIIEYSKNNTSCYYDFYNDTTDCENLSITTIKPTLGKININQENINGIIKYNDDHHYEIIDGKLNLIDKNREDFIIYLDFENQFSNEISKWNVYYNQGTLTNPKVTTTETSKKTGNNSCYFESSSSNEGSSLLVENTSTFSLGNIYTIDFYYSPYNTTQMINYSIIEKGYYMSGVTGGFTLRYDKYKESIDFIITNGTTIVLDLTHYQALQSNSWYRITVTSDGTTVRLFVDGKLVNSKTSSASISAPGYSLAIGGKTATYIQGYNASGYLDDVYINVGECLYKDNF